MEKKVEITAVLDKSGSMQSILHQTIEGFNSYLEKQKLQLGNEANFSLVQFNHIVKTKYTNITLNDVPDLSTSNYKPVGTTALYDAIGHAVKLQKKRNKKVYPNNEAITMILIITDGMENASMKYDRDRIFNKINKMRNEHSWKFIYIGANQDAIYEAGKIGIDKETSIDYCLDDAGIKDIYSSVSEMVVSNSFSKKTVAFLEEDRLKQKR